MNLKEGIKKILEEHIYELCYDEGGNSIQKLHLYTALGTINLGEINI